MAKPIYLDYNATTPIDPQVFEAMLPYLRDDFGNASSTEHAYGWAAAQAVEKARQQCASLINAENRSIIFTSGATEANNLAIFGALRAARPRLAKPHFVTTAIEHKAVLDVARQLEVEGFDITIVAVDEFGQVSAEKILAAIKPMTCLVSVMFGQNEIGTVNPIAEIGHRLPDSVLFHVDAAQAIGREVIDVEAMGIDLLSASGHKFYAPKGSGYLYIRRDVEIEPIQFGGGQERGLRPGTLNVANIVALGVASQICQIHLAEERERLRALRDQFILKVLSSVPTARLNGHPTARLVSNISFSFSGLSADVFALGLPDLAVSAGSACSMGAPSHVLAAIRLPLEHARSTLRFGIGRFTTAADLDLAYDRILAMVKESDRRKN